MVHQLSDVGAKTQSLHAMGPAFSHISLALATLLPCKSGEQFLRLNWKHNPLVPSCLSFSDDDATTTVARRWCRLYAVRVVYTMFLNSFVLVAHVPTEQLGHQSDNHTVIVTAFVSVCKVCRCAGDHLDAINSALILLSGNLHCILSMEECNAQCIYERYKLYACLCARVHATRSTYTQRRSGRRSGATDATPGKCFASAHARNAHKHKALGVCGVLFALGTAMRARDVYIVYLRPKFAPRTTRHTRVLARTI